MKKLLSLMMTLLLVLGLSTAAFAEDGPVPTPGTDEQLPTNTNQDANFTLTYKLATEDTTSPEETFIFTFTADHVTDSNEDLSATDMPAITTSNVKFDAGTATVAGCQKTVAVALSDVQWPDVGVYYYKVNETAGETAGVTYDNTTAYLKVTVAYDEEHNTYYTAFVTLTLADADKDGKNDMKTAGFTNTYSAGSLAVTKTVTGNMGDRETYFDVKVKLTGAEEQDYQNPYTVTGGSHENEPKSIEIGKETTFKLKHGETITIANLPYGVTYTVEEASYSEQGYTTTTTFSDEHKTINSASNTVAIVNNKNVGVDTGIGLDSLPYILVLAIACAGLVAFVSRKRMMREN